MRVETNLRVIKRNRQIAQYTFFVSLAIWLASLIITFIPLFSGSGSTQASWIELAATAVLPFALALALFAVHMTNLWIREPRPEQAIRDGLKGISGKSVLYHYYHTPAKHVLIAPQGIFVMIVRWQNGSITVKNGKWRIERSLLASFASLFRLEGLGDPNQEAQRAVDYVQRILQPIAPDAPIYPLIILTDPRTQITFEEESPIPVLYADEKQKNNLKSFMRNHPNKQGDLPISAEQLKAFEEATLPTTEPA